MHTQNVTFIVKQKRRETTHLGGRYTQMKKLLAIRNNSQGLTLFRVYFVNCTSFENRLHCQSMSIL